MTAQREWFEKDYYAVLGVPQSATDKDLSRAFKKLAKQYHPDANPGNATAEERFKEISAAYDVLGDAAKRAEYDEVRQMVASGVGPDGSGGFGAGGFGAGGGGRTFRFETDGGGLGDIFGNLFGGGGGARRRTRAATGPQRGPRPRDRVAPAVRRRDPRRHVDGALPRRRDVLDVRGFGRGAGHDAGDVPRVSRRGHGCRQPGPVLVLAGLPDVRRARPDHPQPVPDVWWARGRGARPRGEGPDPGGRRRRAAHPGEGPRRRGCERRSARRSLRHRARARARRCSGAANNDLTLRLPVTFTEAALGADIKVPTLDAQVTVRIPPGTPSGKVLRVRGKGVAADGDGKAGDLLVTVEVQVPVNAHRPRNAKRSRRCAAVLDDDPRAALFAEAQDRRKSRWRLTSGRCTSSRSRPSSRACTRRRCASTSARACSRRPARPAAAAATPTATSRCCAGSRSSRTTACRSRACSASSRSKTTWPRRASGSRELEARLAALQREAEQRVEAAHRQYRRELVPVRSAVVARFESRR